MFRLEQLVALDVALCPVAHHDLDVHSDTLAIRLLFVRVYLSRVLTIVGDSDASSHKLSVNIDMLSK